jgi:uncharacterized membrane protein YphA (DoxX/SURF4 family)
MQTAAATQAENTMATHLVVISWVLLLAVAGILLQTLFFKFTGAPESVYIFTKIGAEPWGRIGSGAIELIAAILVLYPRFTWMGALLAASVMCGAILSHLTLLGIEVQGDKGLLFTLALLVLLSSTALLYINRMQIPVLRGYLR